MQHSPGISNIQSHTSHYAPFSGIFPSPQIASDFRKEALRFQRTPYRSLESDPSTQELETNRQYNIERIYNAMTRGDIAKDNSGSIAMRRWVHSDFYPSDLVEAYAHKVFDCLIEQAKYGFRGWHHNDYASDDRKGEPEDKDVSCAERLDNVIQAITEEKTICEDIMTSACQIRMFVNAPRAYARRKEANRHGNSKRRKATVSTSSRITKHGRPNLMSPIRSLDTISSATFHPTQSHFVYDENQHQNVPREPCYHAAQAPLIHSPISEAGQQSITSMDHMNTDLMSASALSVHHRASMSTPQPDTGSPQFNSVQAPHLSPFQSPSSTDFATSATPEEFSFVRRGASSYLWPSVHASSSSAFQGHSAFDADLLQFPGAYEAVKIWESTPHGEGASSYGLPIFVSPSELNIDPSLGDISSF
jgi:hypothetical protein